MKLNKILVLGVTFLGLMAGNLRADDTAPYSTDGHINGGIFDGGMAQHGKDTTFGIIDALSYTNHEEFIALYPNIHSSQDIIDAVMLYYLQNPSKKGRPIIEVVLSGCK